MKLLEHCVLIAPGSLCIIAKKCNSFTLRIACSCGLTCAIAKNVT